MVQLSRADAEPFFNFERRRIAMSTPKSVRFIVEFDEGAGQVIAVEFSAKQQPVPPPGLPVRWVGR
jgi:hypothetical protein